MINKKFSNRFHYDPIKSLNDEVERDLITPLLMIPTILLVIVLLITFVVRHAEAIDRFGQQHWRLLGWSLFLGGLFGVIRWTKNRML